MNGKTLVDYIVIFGAAVLADGTPSRSLQRRIDGALQWWRVHQGAIFIPTGGIGRQGPAEAEVMRGKLVDAGVNPLQIITETQARDTLDSIRYCHELLAKQGNVRSIICCTSSYHQTRCKVLFRMLGYRVVVPPMPSDREGLSRVQYIRYIAKEFVALPYDMIQLAVRSLISPRARS